MREERFDTVVVGGGQAGLAVGYYLARRRRDFVIVDAGERIGQSWDERWDSLRLFSPAHFTHLPGLRFPGPRRYLPAKDEMADYLRAYTAKFGLLVDYAGWVSAGLPTGSSARCRRRSSWAVCDRASVPTSDGLVVGRRGWRRCQTYRPTRR